MTRYLTTPWWSLGEWDTDRQELSLGQDFLEERLQLGVAQEQGNKEKNAVYVHLHRRRVEGEERGSAVAVSKAERRAAKRAAWEQAQAAALVSQPCS